MVKKEREQDIQKAVLQFLSLRGWFAWRVNSGAMSGEHNGKRWYMKFNGAPGCSDIIGVSPQGRFLACEVKRPGNKPTELQSAFLERVRASGGIGIVVTGIADLDQQLKAMGAAGKDQS